MVFTLRFVLALVTPRSGREVLIKYPAITFYSGHFEIKWPPYNFSNKDDEGNLYCLVRAF